MRDCPENRSCGWDTDNLYTKNINDQNVKPTRSNCHTLRER